MSDVFRDKMRWQVEGILRAHMVPHPILGPVVDRTPPLRGRNLAHVERMIDNGYFDRSWGGLDVHLAYRAVERAIAMDEQDRWRHLAQAHA